MRLSKNDIPVGNVVSYDGECAFPGVAFPYPIREVKRCLYQIDFEKIGGYPHAFYSFSATLEVEDQLGGAPFLYELEVEEEECDIMECEDGEGIGFILPGPSIEIEELLAHAIVSALPLRIDRPA